MNSIIVADGGYKLALTGSAEEQRKKLIEAAERVPAVTDADSQAAAFDVMKNIRAWMKSVESARVEVKAPILQASRLIDSLASEHIAPLEAAVKTLDRMLSAFHETEQKRIAEEQKRVDEEIALRKQIEDDAKWEAKQAAKELEKPDASEEDLARAVEAEAEAKLEAERTMAALRTPVVTTPTRQAGMVIRKVVKWEITDEKKLFAAMPHFFRIEPNRAVINGSVTKTTKIDGLKVWEEVATGARV